jgi:hypothetical protein
MALNNIFFEAQNFSKVIIIIKEKIVALNNIFIPFVKKSAQKS